MTQSKKAHDPHGAVLVSRKRAGKAPDSRTIARRASVLLNALDAGDAELSVLLCDDEQIRELNRDYRGKDRATDVLSFAMEEGEQAWSPHRILGDVIISTETAARQAEEGGITLLEEVTSLLIHGVLHLMGYDHETPEEERRMHGTAKDLEALFDSPSKTKSPAEKNRKKLP